MAPTTPIPFDLAAMTQTADVVDVLMKQFLESRPLPENLREAIQYQLLGGGKRLRLTLVLRCCEVVGGTTEVSAVPAAAVEMVHAFSLVHDDLPAMDDDDLRRGRPTLHKHTNEAMAILAGDALMGLAFELIATRVRPGELAGIVCRELAVATNDMIAGQVYDTLGGFDSAVEPRQRLQITHRYKTASLIRGACRMGALCGGATVGQLDALSRYGEAIGLMFQIVDDMLDVTQTTEQLGKAAGKDEAKGKRTYPGVLGLEASKGHIVRLQAKAIAALESLGESAEPLRDLGRFLAERRK